MEHYQVSLSHNLCDMFQQELSPITIPLFAVLGFAWTLDSHEPQHEGKTDQPEEEIWNM